MIFLHQLKPFWNAVKCTILINIIRWKIKKEEKKNTLVPRCTQKEGRRNIILYFFYHDKKKAIPKRTLNKDDVMSENYIFSLCLQHVFFFFFFPSFFFALCKLKLFITLTSSCSSFFVAREKNKLNWKRKQKKNTPKHLIGTQMRRYQGNNVEYKF